MSQTMIDIRAFDRRDYKTGRWKCRVCEKPAEPPKRYYCSDEHRKLFNLALSWNHTRNLVLKRDNYRCVKCEKIVSAHYHHYDRDKREFMYAEEIAHVHHVIPVVYLWNEILIAVEGLEGKIRDRRIQQLQIIVFHHIDNLVTLCEEDHKDAHQSGWYDKFKLDEMGQKTLEVFNVA